MHLKLISSAALALSLVAGAAIAQSSGGSTEGAAAPGQTVTNPPQGIWASPEEQAMFEENRETMSVFFVDEDWSAWRSEAELQAAWEAMSPEDQAAMKADCEGAVAAQTTLGPAATSICTWAGVTM